VNHGGIAAQAGEWNDILLYGILYPLLQSLSLSPPTFAQINRSILGNKIIGLKYGINEGI
jgi:hypothetical protein